MQLDVREGSSRRDKAGIANPAELVPRGGIEPLDGAVGSGMEDGMRETFDQLDEFVASLRG